MSAPAVSVPTQDLIAANRASFFNETRKEMAPVVRGIYALETADQIFDHVFSVLAKMFPQGPASLSSAICRVRSVDEFCRRHFSNDWGVLAERLRNVEAAENINAQLDDEYFRDLKRLVEALGNEHRSVVYSTQKDAREGVILHDFMLALIGLPIFRTVLVNARFGAARAKAEQYYLEKNGLGLGLSQLSKVRDAVSCFNRDGIYIEDCWSGVGFSDIRRRLDDMEEVILSKETKREGDTIIYRHEIKQIENAIFDDVYTNEFLALWNIVSGTIDQAPRLFVEVLFHGKDDTDGNKLYHVDTFHPTVKWWSTLKPVGLDDGPFNYVPGTQAWNGRRVFWYYCRFIAQRLSLPSFDGSFRIGEPDLRYLCGEKYEVLECAAPADTLIVADTSGVHRRGHAAVGKRRDLFFGWSRHVPAIE